MIIVIQIKENSIVHFPTHILESTRTQDRIRQPIKIEKGTAIFATPNAHTNDLDKEGQNLSCVTDSIDLHEQIYCKIVQLPILRLVGSRVLMGFRNGYINSKQLHSVNYFTKKALTMWKEAHLEQNDERN